MEKNKLISPSVLSADFGNLERDIKMLNSSECDWIHCDVMDGNFVPNISFGFPVLKAIKKVAEKPLDVHLMIENADQYVDEFKAAGAGMLTVHFENNRHLDRLCSLIRSKGMYVGVAINPATPIMALRDIFHMVDMVLVMSVNPGFGGQSFLEHTYSKLMQLSSLRQDMRMDFMIEVDGGVNAENASKLYEAGADVLVAGNAVFNAPDPLAMIQKIKGMA